MKRHIAAYAIATGLPVALLVAGALGTGWAVWAALASVTVLVAGLDGLLMPEDAAHGPSSGSSSGPSDLAANALSVVLACAHFAVLVLTVRALAHPDLLSGTQKAGMFVAAGLFMGQVSNSNAHELIHRPARWMRRLGAAVYTSLLFGHHASAHPAVHHRLVATPEDPNTSRLNESFYRFAPRAWRGSFRAGLTVEVGRLARRGHGGWHRANPYWGYVAGGAGALALAAGFWGVNGAAAYAGLALYATMQLLLSDYVQHYGLGRARRPDGGYEPVGPEHSWNAPHWYSALLMLNAPRHSDHHAHPSKTFPTLVLPEPGDAPQLPRSLPVIATLALFPRRFRRVMNPRVRAWTEPADRLADRSAVRKADAAEGI